MKTLASTIATALLLLLMTAPFLQAQLSVQEKNTFQISNVSEDNGLVTYELTAANLDQETFASLQDYKNFQMAPLLILHPDFVGYHFINKDQLLKVTVKKGDLTEEIVLNTLNNQTARKQSPIAQK